MRNVVLSITMAGLLAGCQGGPVRVDASAAQPASAKAATEAFDVVVEAERLAAQDLWPGFDLQSVPVAIYDGERTLLFRHAAAPDGFQQLQDHDDVWAYAGRHPAVTANSSAELGGVLTATLMPATGPVTLRARAALLVHEAFHVFQRARHPTWSANEVDLFVYPVDDSGLLALRRLETRALGRALASDTSAHSACWARTALAARHRRFAAMGPAAVAYERGTELNEGLATYVERRALAASATDLMPDAPFAPEQVRQRAYRTGAALARLLDTAAPDWRAALERDDVVPLDGLLDEALAKHPADASACTFTNAERAQAQVEATADVQALSARLLEQRHAFLERDGWRVVVDAAQSPLFPQGFDPLNVQVMGRGEVLHTRFLELGGDAGAFEVLGRPTLTEAAGAHPLFNGVRMLTLTGLPAAPVVTEADGGVRIEADGVSATFRAARVARSARTVIIRVLPPP